MSATKHLDGVRVDGGVVSAKGAPTELLVRVRVRVRSDAADAAHVAPREQPADFAETETPTANLRIRLRRR